MLVTFKHSHLELQEHCSFDSRCDHFCSIIKQTLFIFKSSAPRSQDGKEEGKLVENVFSFH